MKFTVTFVATLALFTVLVHRGESNLEEVTKAIPSEVANLLTDFSAGPHFYKTGEDYYEDRVDFNFTSRASPEADEASSTSKTIGNSVVLVSFNLNVPAVTLNGNLTYKELRFPNAVHTGNFTTITLNSLNLKLDVYYAFKTKSVIIKSKVEDKIDKSATEFAWTEGNVPSFARISIENRLETLVSTTFSTELAETVMAVVNSKKSELLKKLDDLYRSE